MNEADKPVEEPTKGGSYVRNEDGSLTLLERTQEATQRDKRQTDTTAAAVDPGAAKPAAPVVDLGSAGHQE